MREEVCAQAPGSGSLWARTEEKWGCRPNPRRRGSNFREERRTK